MRLRAYRLIAATDLRRLVGANLFALRKGRTMQKVLPLHICTLSLAFYLP